MVANGEAPARGSAAAAASLRRRRASSGSGAAVGSSTMLQFYADDTAGCRMSPITVVLMSIGFIIVVALLHIVGNKWRN